MQNINILEYFKRKEDNQSSKQNTSCVNITSKSKSLLKTKRSKLENDETLATSKSNSLYYEHDSQKHILRWKYYGTISTEI